MKLFSLAFQDHTSLEVVITDLEPQLLYQISTFFEGTTVKVQTCLIHFFINLWKQMLHLHLHKVITTNPLFYETYLMMKLSAYIPNALRYYFMAKFTDIYNPQHEKAFEPIAGFLKYYNQYVQFGKWAKYLDFKKGYDYTNNNAEGYNSRVTRKFRIKPTPPNLVKALNY